MGAIYKPTSGNTEMFIELTEETGLTITVNFYKKVSSGTITINWGDGTTSSNSATGANAKYLTHTYSSYGEYMISIISTINYGLGGNSSISVYLREFISFAELQVKAIPSEYGKTSVAKVRLPDGNQDLALKMARARMEIEMKEVALLYSNIPIESKKEK